jgi:co-chaperonin GroES (HSP10)
MAKRLIPLFDRVLIQKAEAVTKTKGGIVIPEKAQAKVLRGTVVAIGPGSRNQVCDAVSCLFLYCHSEKVFIENQPSYCSLS